MPVRSTRSLAIGLLVAITATAGAQETAPTNKRTTVPSPYSRVDLYGGYAFLQPSGSVEGFNYQRITDGAVTSASIYFKKRVGVQVEAGFHPYGYAPLDDPYLVAGHDCVNTVQGGPIFRFPKGNLSPFVHVLAGAAEVGGPRFQPCTWGLGITAGGGLDYVFGFWNKHLAVRLFQLDYEYMNVDFGPPVPHGLAGGTANINAFRASTGIVLRLGDLSPLPGPSLECTTNPSEIYAGAPVNVSASLKNFDIKKALRYKWSTTGGTLSPDGPSIIVDTKNLDAGTYTLTANVFYGNKTTALASCSASFVVKPVNPPTISCSANPSTVAPGEPSMITAVAVSESNRPLTYSYTTSAGQIAGDTAKARLDTNGVPPGIVTVLCAATDDMGHKSTAPVVVTVTAPPLPPAPKPEALCTLTFYRDIKRPVRVDNEARACLDDIALTMQHQPESKLVIVGEHSETEPALSAAQRAVNTKAYLSNEKGIDPARIEVRTSSRPGKTAENFLLAPGTTFEDTLSAPAPNVPVSKEAYSTAASQAAAEAKQQHKAPAAKPAPKPPAKPKTMEGVSTPKQP